MSRHINLLVQPEAIPEFSADRALIVLALILAAFLGYAVYASLAVTRLGEAVTLNNANLEALKVERNAKEQKLRERPKLADLLVQMDALQARAAESQEIVNLLRGGGSASEAYAAQLVALASISEDGVWLTGVKIGNAGKTVSLTGRALRHESVLRYAERLNEGFSVYGAQFTALELTPEAAKEGAAGSSAGPAVSSVAFKLF